MILYHFTDIYNLHHPEDGGTILKEGLKPNGKKDGVPPLDAVWFTSESDPQYMFRCADGALDRWKTDRARIRVVIPSTDKRLVKWETWLRKQRVVEMPDGRLLRSSDMISRLIVGWKSYYVYFGAVAPTAYRAVEYADPEMRAEIEREIDLGAVELFTLDDGIRRAS